MVKDSVRTDVVLPTPIGRIALHAAQCAGCSICEAVCSLSHEGVVSPSLSRIVIVDNYVDGHRVAGYTCAQCREPECLLACPIGALHADEKTGARVIDAERCDGCRRCVVACPQYPNAPIRFDPIRHICLMCDLCGGEPLCVKFCPESALSFRKKRYL